MDKSVYMLPVLGTCFLLLWVISGLWIILGFATEYFAWCASEETWPETLAVVPSTKQTPTTMLILAALFKSFGRLWNSEAQKDYKESRSVMVMS